MYFLKLLDPCRQGQKFSLMCGRKHIHTGDSIPKLTAYNHASLPIYSHSTNTVHYNDIFEDACQNRRQVAAVASFLALNHESVQNLASCEAWYALNFSGQVIDPVLRDKYVRFGYDLPTSEHPAEYGQWDHNGATSGSTAAPGDIAALIDAIQRKDVTGVKRGLEACFADTIPEIRSRERVNRSVLARVLVEQTSASIIDLIATGRGLGYQCFANLCLWLLLEQDAPIIYQWLKSAGAYQHGIGHYMKLTKTVHDVSRRIQAIPKGWVQVDFVKLSYLNILAGRFWHRDVYEADTVTKRTRTIPGGHLAYDRLKRKFTRAAFDDRLKQYYKWQLANVSKDLQVDQPLTLNDWLVGSLTYGSSGSAGGDTKEVEALGYKFTGSVSKRLWLAFADEEKINRRLNAEPIMEGTTVDKFEAGKWRNLSPVVLQHWLIENMAIQPVENLVYKNIPNIMLERSLPRTTLAMMERLRKLQSGWEVMATDYADFNYTHMYRHLVLWFDMLSEMYSREPSLRYQYTESGESRGSFLARAATWCARALENARQVDGRDPTRTPHHVIQGLWSGWRTTQFFNTLLNAAYFQIAAEDAKDVYGVHITPEADLQGDDSARENSVYGTAVFLADMLCRQNHELNSGKQLLTSDMTELLRIYYFRDGRMSGSLNRSIASFTSSDGQAPVPVPSQSFVSGCHSAYQTLVARGAHKAKAWQLLLTTAAFWATFRQGGTAVTASNKTLMLRVADGGFGFSQVGRLPLADNTKVGWPEQASYSDHRPMLVPNTIKYLAKRLHLAGAKLANPDEIRDDIGAAAFGEDIPTQERDAIISERYRTAFYHVHATNERMKTAELYENKCDLKMLGYYCRYWRRKFALFAVPVTDYDPEANAEAVRAIALGKAGTAAAALNKLSTGDTAMTANTIAAIAIALQPGKAKRALSALYSAVTPMKAAALLTRREKLALDTGGLVPQEFRLYLHDALKSTGAYAKEYDELATHAITCGLAYKFTVGKNKTL